ncbi:protein of unknown function [Haloarcula vallismortis]|uniref:Protein-glutamine gamma-glutamyltransferase-like C-terminal domain-containing protein n=2 Tax=Haloarcula vallismortis TaxID=28442 RepID=M0IZ90_HALVA|nr:DUF4129 domain-containing protein [Haloarcula vallismortis]EMA01084.1 hypothetical protein C437_19857 [Haloarcula vallismortis ATCC 29715]SDW14825.1 protein of unknown function [Haloarcula vallismortis]
MSTKLVRAALALLCAVAVLFGTALFPGALGVEFESSGPLDSQASEPVTPDGTASGEADSGPTTVATSDAVETTPRATSDTPAATATPTPTETTTETPAAGGGENSESSVLVKLVGLALIGGFGIVAVSVIRAASNAEGDRSTVAGLRLHPLLDTLFGTVVSAVSNGVVGRTISRIPKATTAALLSGSSALARVGAGISAVSGGILTGLTTGIGSVGAMSLRGVAGLPSALGSLSVAPFRALSGFGGSGGFLASVRSGVDSPSLFGSSDAASGRSAATESTAAADDGPDIDSLSIQEAWGLLADRVSVSDPETATPGEYARQAIDSGLPAEPVRQLTTLFREVEYGGRSATGERTESAQAALRHLLDGGDD